MAATLLARNNSRIIGVVIHNHPKYEGHLLEDPFVAGALNALSKEITAAGYFLMLKTTDTITEAEPFASMWNMDGMILMGFCADEYQALRNRIRIPFVVYDRYLGLCKGLSKEAEFWQVPIKLSERRIFYESRMTELLKYTAIFAVSDYYAVDIMHFLASIRVKVPDDISIVGFDDTMLSRTVNPTLSTVRQDVEYRAKEAVKYLKEIREDRNYSVTVKIPVELVIRESSGKILRLS